MVTQSEKSLVDLDTNWALTSVLWPSPHHQSGPPAAVIMWFVCHNWHVSFEPISIQVPVIWYRHLAVPYLYVITKMSGQKQPVAAQCQWQSELDECKRCAPSCPHLLSPWFWLQERVSELVGDMISWQPHPKLTRSRFCFVSGRKHFCKFRCGGYDRISFLLCLVSCILRLNTQEKTF